MIYLQVQREGETLCPALEAPRPLAQPVESRHLVLAAEARSGHQGAAAQQHVSAASTTQEGRHIQPCVRRLKVK